MAGSSRDEGLGALQPSLRIASHQISVSKTRHADCTVTGNSIKFRHNESRIICPCSACNRITPLVHMAAHQSSRRPIVVMHIKPLLKVIGVTLEQTP